MSVTSIVPRALLTAREAAEYLRVSQRTLYSLSQPRGPIPVVRVTAWAVRYDRRDLERYIEAARQGGAA